jgi:putative salt-induced outer membrane protein
MRKALSILALSLAGFASDRDGSEKPFSVHIELSFVRTTGNTDTQTFSEKAEVKYEGKVHRLFLKNSSLFATQDRRETANRFDLIGRWERLFTDRLFGFLNASYERDRFSGYEYKISGGPGAGYDLLKTKRHELKVLGSYIYYYNRLASDGIQEYPTFKADAFYQWHIRDNLRFKENLSYILNLEDTQTYFINSETSLEVKINRYFSLGVGYKVAYQNRPPQPGIKRLDTTFSTSFIADF